MPSFVGAGNNSRKLPSLGKQIGEGLTTQSNLPTDEPQQRRVSKILETLQSGGPCSLDALAAKFNLSKSHLQHLFKQRTGLRLGHCLVEQRLLRAAHLLRFTNMRVKEIASAVGYGHTSSFTRAFERRFRQPPQAYRHHGDHSTADK
jgi:transcriptional regulator GlxA family with amidase domain